MATAYVLLVLGYMLDSCDGQLARVSGKTSKFGEWLDHSLDIVKILNFNMVLGYLLLSAAVLSRRKKMFTAWLKRTRRSRTFVSEPVRWWYEVTGKGGCSSCLSWFLRLNVLWGSYSGTQDSYQSLPQHWHLRTR